MSLDAICNCQIHKNEELEEVGGGSLCSCSLTTSLKLCTCQGNIALPPLALHNQAIWKVLVSKDIPNRVFLYRFWPMGKDVLQIGRTLLGLFSF
jgi:hypothetical protein